MTSGLLFHLQLCLCVAVALGVYAPPAAAQSEALRVLLGPLADSTLNAAAPAAGSASGLSAGSAAPQGARMQVTVRRGESLTTVIRRTLPDTPYKDDLVRRAFVQLNPSAFAGGPHRLAAGAVLLVPTAQDLRMMADGGSAGASAYAAQGGLSGQSGAGHSASRSADEERKKWVRFP